MHTTDHIVPQLATPLSWEEPFRPVALRLRLSANLPFSVERDSAQRFFFAQTVADERPHSLRSQNRSDENLADVLLFRER
jgi:hypothetical protein